jgi:Tfp pilus assembly protein PilV
MRTHPSDDRGAALLELLMAVVIMAIAVGAIVGGLLTSITVSDTHRKEATSGALARSYADTIAQYATTNAHYADCASTTTYKPVTVGYTLPADYTAYTAQVSLVEYWNATTKQFAGSCSSSGLQRVTVEVSSPDDVTERVVLVLRKPCGPGDSLC